MRTLGQRAGAAGGSFSAAVLATMFALSPVPAVAVGFDGDLVTLRVYAPTITPANLIGLGAQTVGLNVEFPSIADLATQNLPVGSQIAPSSGDITTTSIITDFAASVQGFRIGNGDLIYSFMTPNEPSISGLMLMSNIPGVTASFSTNSVDFHFSGVTLPSNTPGFIQADATFGEPVTTPIPIQPTKPDAILFNASGLEVISLGGAILGCAAIRSCAALLTSGGATAAELQITGLGLNVFGGLLQLLGSDPFDLNYTVVAPPATTAPPTLSPTAPDAFVDLVASATKAGDLVNAMIAAFNRAEGAFLSDEPSFEQLQLDAFNNYEQQLSDYLVQIGVDYNQIASSIGGQFPDIFGNFGNQLISDAGMLAGSSTPVNEPSSAMVVLSGIIILLLCASTVRPKCHLCKVFSISFILLRT